MAARSIASLSLSFGLVSIPVKVYSATESSAGVSFNLLHNCGSRVKQQYICIKENVPVERADMVKGYEFEKDRYVMFTPDELKALEEAARHTIDIVSFIPLSAVDPIYYDKAYYLAPDKRGAQAVRPAARGDARERPLRAGALGLEGQAVRRAGAPRRRRPRSCSSCCTPTRCAR